MAEIRVRTEEGHYTIKRVPRLPKRGNANWLFAIIDSKIEKFYRWDALKSVWETITIGGGGGIESIVAGANITITGSGTDADPLIINSLGGGGIYTIDIVSDVLKLYENGTEVGSEDLSAYLDNTNLSRLVSGSISSGIITLVRDDATDFDIDISTLVKTNTSDFVNDGADGTSTYVELDDLSSVQQGLRGVNANVSINYTLDHNLFTDWKITLTGDTIFTDTNLPTSNITTEFTIKMTGEFVPTFPSYWDILGDLYSGEVWNFITVQIHDGNSGTEEATAFISNFII